MGSMTSNVKTSVMYQLQNYFEWVLVIEDIDIQSMNKLLKKYLIDGDKLPLWSNLNDLTYNEMLWLLDDVEMDTFINTCMKYQFTEEYKKKREEQKLNAEREEENRKYQEAQAKQARIDKAIDKQTRGLDKKMVKLITRYYDFSDNKKLLKEPLFLGVFGVAVLSFIYFLSNRTNPGFLGFVAVIFTAICGSWSYNIRKKVLYNGAKERMEEKSPVDFNEYMELSKEKDRIIDEIYEEEELS